jgi:hypothetical protein
MLLASTLVRLLSDQADHISRSIVVLVRRHVFAAAVAIRSVAPVNKAINPGPYR